MKAGRKIQKRCPPNERDFDLFNARHRFDFLSYIWATSIPTASPGTFFLFPCAARLKKLYYSVLVNDIFSFHTRGWARI